MDIRGEPVGVEVLGDGELPMAVGVLGYRKSTDGYAGFYGVTDRTVKRWKKAGRECGEMPPLDDVVRFVTWWRVRMKHKVPDNILQLLPAEPVAEVAVEVLQDPINLLNVDESTDMGLSTIRRVVALRSLEVGRAYESGDKMAIDRAVREVESASRTLRMLEKTHAELAKAGGDLVSKKAVQAELTPLIGRLGASVLECMVRAVRAVAPGMDREEALAVCVPERDRCFSVLRGELVA